MRVNSRKMPLVMKMKLSPIIFSASYFRMNPSTDFFVEGGNFIYHPTLSFVLEEDKQKQEHVTTPSDSLLDALYELLSLVKEKWDHYTYLPKKSRFLSFKQDDNFLTCKWKRKKNKMELMLPLSECLMLPVETISLDNICRLISIDLLSITKLTLPEIFQTLIELEAALESPHGKVELSIIEPRTIITAT